MIEQKMLNGPILKGTGKLVKGSLRSEEIRVRRLGMMTFSDFTTI